MNKHLVRLLIFYLLSVASYPVYGDVVVRLSDKENVNQVTEIGNKVWFASRGGVYQIHGNSISQGLIENVRINTIVGIDGELWIGTADGLYKYSEADGLYKYSEREATSAEKEMGWVQFTNGANRADSKKESTPTLIDSVNVIKEVHGGLVWIGSRRGLFQFKKDSGFFTASNVQGSVNDIQWYDGRLWVATSNNAYMIDYPESGDPMPKPLFKESIYVSKAVEASGEKWLITMKSTGSFEQYGPCFRIDNNFKPRQVNVSPIRDSGVVAIREVDQEVWYSTSEKAGLYKKTDKGFKRIIVNGLNEPINTISLVKNQVWLGSTHKAYRRSNGIFEPLPAAGRISIHGIAQVADKIWMWGNDGLYRVDHDVDMQVRYNIRSLGFISLVLGDIVRVEEANYSTSSGQDPYGETRRGDVIIGGIEVSVQPASNLSRDLRRDSDTPTESFEQKAPWMERLSLAARDRHGNTVPPDLRNVLAAPLSSFLKIAGILALVVAFVTVLILARWSKACMAFVMFPTLRRLGSLGIIPMLLRLAFFKRYLLRRYFKELANFKGSSRRHGAQMLKNQTEEIFSKIDQDRCQRLLVVGSPGTTRNVFRFISSAIADKKIPLPSYLRRCIPMYLRLDLYARSEGRIESAVLSKLSSLGGITDPELAKDFVHHLSFLFLMDGLDKLRDEKEKCVYFEQFVDSYCQNDFVVVGSKDEGVDLDGFREVVRLSQGEITVDQDLTRPII